MLAGGGTDKYLLGKDGGAIVGDWLDMWFLLTEFGWFSNSKTTVSFVD